MARAFALAGALAWLTPGVALAQDQTVDIQLFRPYSDAYGYLAVPSAATLRHLQLGASFWGDYSNDPIVLLHNGERVASGSGGIDGDVGDGLIDSRFLGNAQLGMGFSRFFSLTVDLPVVLSQDGTDVTTLDDPGVAPAPLIGTGVGDLRVQPKVAILDRKSAPFGLALQAPVSLPTGTGGSFLGEGGVSAAPSVVLELSDAQVHTRDYRWRFAVQGGYLLRPADRVRDVAVGNAGIYGVAAGLHPAQPLEITAEFHGLVFGDRAAQTPAEVLLGLKFYIGDLVAINLGGGVGALGGIGAPDYRMVGGLTFAPSFDPNARDSDDDGVSDGEDRCPKDPEDIDDYQDTDGCPDEDNDLDGIPDDADQCPNDAEDDDGFMDVDGCPDTDNDKDGISDASDRCPNEAENQNGFQDDDGCPDEAPLTDGDGDGYNDEVDRCPYDAEDFDGFQDEDGCPEKDNDNDGVTDDVDQCPNVREIFNGVKDEDGCPDEGRVVVEKNFIKILDMIYFDTGKATIQSKSFSLVDEIASTLTANPQIKKIRVEGHTDNVGDDMRNLKLSQARAESVMAGLIQRGVSSNRLEAVGFGEMRPVGSNDDESGRQANRRVEFIIVDQD